MTPHPGNREQLEQREKAVLGIRQRTPAPEGTGDGVDVFQAHLEQWEHQRGGKASQTADQQPIGQIGQPENHTDSAGYRQIKSSGG